jgi:hypothetical protein
LDVLVLYILGDRGGTGSGERGAMRPSDVSLRVGFIRGNSMARLLNRDLKSEPRERLAAIDGAIWVSVSLTIAGDNECVSTNSCRQRRNKCTSRHG